MYLYVTKLAVAGTDIHSSRAGTTSPSTRRPPGGGGEGGGGVVLPDGGGVCLRWEDEKNKYYPPGTWDKCRWPR